MAALARIRGLAPLGHLGEKIMTSYTILKTPVSDLLLSANETELTGVHFGGEDHVPMSSKTWKRDDRHPVLRQAVKELKEYFAGKRTIFSFAPSSAGTEFRQRVWAEIARIPFGETISYSELAKRAGNPKAFRAAGAATGMNPLGIVIPCHRVLAKGGGIGGYAGGLARKKMLLQLEGVLDKELFDTPIK
jgi:O-6-methylguanine DNA methyltransferase